MDCNLPGSSVHGISQARILEWVALPFHSPGDLPDSGVKPVSPALQADSLLLSYLGSPLQGGVCRFKDFVVEPTRVGNDPCKLAKLVSEYLLVSLIKFNTFSLINFFLYSTFYSSSSSFFFLTLLQNVFQSPATKQTGNRMGTSVKLAFPPDSEGVIILAILQM